jgi:hypothetical protein
MRHRVLNGAILLGIAFIAAARAIAGSGSGSTSGGSSPIASAGVALFNYPQSVSLGRRGPKRFPLGASDFDLQ